MPELGQVVDKIRSKNAGPFWVTIDLFCGSEKAFDWTCAHLSDTSVAALYDVPLDDLKRFEIADLFVIKFSFPRPVIQGTLHDRDMHGAAWAPLLQELMIDASPPAQ